MTLICRIEFQGEMLLISDGLISAEHSEQGQKLKNATLASGQSTGLPSSEGKPFRIVGTHLKIEKITENFLISWAGSSIHARSFVRELKERAEMGRVAIEDVDAILDSWEQRDLNEVSLLCQFVTPHADSPNSFELRSIDLNCLEVQVGEFRLVGSGSGFDDFVRKFKDTISSIKIEGQAPELLLEYLGLLPISHLMTEEVFVGDQLRSAWGGLYEATVVGANAKFTNLDSVTWAFFVAREEAGKNGFSVSMLTKFTALRYFDGCPVYIDVVFHAAESNKARIESASIFGFSGFFSDEVKNIYEKLQEKPIQEIDFDSKTLCLALAAPVKNGGIGVLVKHDSGGQMPMSIKFTDSVFAFSMAKDLKREILASFERNLCAPVSDSIGIQNFKAS